MFCDSCTSHRAEIKYLNPEESTVVVQHRICAECAAVREDCFLAQTEGNSGLEIDVKRAALEVELLSVTGLGCDDPDDEPSNAQLKVLLIFANETKYSRLIDRPTSIDDDGTITWNESFQFRVNDSSDDSTELFVELLNGDDINDESALVSRKQRVLKNSGYGYSSIHLDSLTSTKKLQSGAPISLNLPLLGGSGNGGSITITVRITDTEPEDDQSETDTVTFESPSDKVQSSMLQGEIDEALDSLSDIDSVEYNANTAMDDSDVLDENDEERAARLGLTNKNESFKVLTEAAHSLEDELSNAQEVDEMIRKLQYSIIADEEPDTLTKVESDACVELSRALSGKTSPTDHPVERYSLTTNEENVEGEDEEVESSGSDESSSSIESSSEEDDSSEDDGDVGVSSNDDNLEVSTEQSFDSPETNLPLSSSSDGVKSFKLHNADAAPQYAPPKVFIEKTKSYKKVPSRLMNPTRASEGSRWDKPITHHPDSSQHSRDEYPTKKSAFRQTTETYDKKADKKGAVSRGPAHHGFEPSEYNNVSKFQRVQSRLLEPTKAFLESRRVVSTPASKFPKQQQRHISPYSGRSSRALARDFENDVSSLREESVASSLSALTDSDSHVSPMESPGGQAAPSSNASHYAPPIIAKHGITSYNHVQVQKIAKMVVLNLVKIFFCLLTPCFKFFL